MSTKSKTVTNLRMVHRESHSPAGHSDGFDPIPTQGLQCIIVVVHTDLDPFIS